MFHWPQLLFLTVVGTVSEIVNYTEEHTQHCRQKYEKCLNAAHENFLVGCDTGKNCTHSLSLVFLHSADKNFQRRLSLVL